MSVHTFTTQQGNDEVVVTMGWDRPLQGYFMTITRIDSNPEGNTEDEEEHFLFNNLEQQKEGKNEKDLYIHNNFDGTDSLHSAPGPDT